MYTLERVCMCVYEYRVQDRSFIGQVRKYFLCTPYENT